MRVGIICLLRLVYFGYCNSYSRMAKVDEPKKTYNVYPRQLWCRSLKRSANEKVRLYPPPCWHLWRCCKDILKNLQKLTICCLNERKTLRHKWRNIVKMFFLVGVRYFLLRLQLLGYSKACTLLCQTSWNDY